MGNKTYDRLKYLVQIFIPAISTFYFALSGVWGLPYAEKVTGSLAILCTFIGAIIGVSSKNYTPQSDSVGTLIVDHENDEQPGVYLHVSRDTDLFNPNKLEGVVDLKHINKKK